MESWFPRCFICFLRLRESAPSGCLPSVKSVKAAAAGMNQDQRLGTQMLSWQMELTHTDFLEGFLAPKTFHGHVRHTHTRDFKALKT